MKNQLEITTHTPGETRALGRAVGERAQAGDIFLLEGNLGTGKTTFTQGLAWGLGIREYAVSPTFTLVRELYGRLPLYHMDLYRLDRLAEIDDLGLDDYFFGRGVSVVEWAEKGEGLFPAEHMLVNICYLSEQSRRFRFTAHGRRYAELLSELKAVKGKA